MRYADKTILAGLLSDMCAMDVPLQITLTLSELLLDLYIPGVNQKTFGYKSYRFEAPSVWNSLDLEIRKAENFNDFKKLINSWTGPSCRCNFCNDSEDELSF